MATESVEVHGHIVDSLILAKVLDAIVDAGADYVLEDVAIGRTTRDASRARIRITADDPAVLGALVDDLQVHGANRIATSDAVLVAAELDGVLPAGFHATTNLETDVLVDGTWLQVENPEMDCGLVVADGSVRTVPMHRVRAGERVVVGHDGVRVHPPERRGASAGFEFMASEVSSEKPKGLLIRHVAARMRAARAEGAGVLLVPGPAAIHTGAGPALARLVEHGWVQCLFTGNGFATHDIESNVLGTSLGVAVADGAGVEGGHANHLRVINELRRHGSIAAAVDAGYVTGGVMHACVTHRVPFVLGGSVRDDGPLPDTITDVAVAADAMRDHVPGIRVALMLATTLHAIATGNLLPASVETFCVDINQAVVTKLADRGSHQAVGIVTDIGVFAQALADELCP